MMGCSFPSDCRYGSGAEKLSNGPWNERSSARCFRAVARSPFSIACMNARTIPAALSMSSSHDAMLVRRAASSHDRLSRFSCRSSRSIAGAATHRYNPTAMKDLGAGIGHDQLSDVLRSVRFRSVVYCRSELGAPWGFTVAGRDFATFHLVTRGRCCLEIDGLKGRVWLGEGDLIILPTGRAHTLRDAASSPATPLEELIARAAPDANGTLRSGSGGAPTALVCGGFQFEDRAANPLLASLPPIIHLRGRHRVADGWLNLTLAFLAEEAASNRPGAETMMIRLADLLFIRSDARR